MKPSRRGSEPAFTLVELLVVIAVIALLASLLMPTLGRSQESGRSAVCQGNLHQIGLALQIYVDDNKNFMPTMYDRPLTNAATNLLTIDVVLAPQLGAKRVLRCPSDNQNIFEKTASSYSWNSLLNGQKASDLHVLNLNLTITRIPLVFDKQAFHASLGSKHAVNYLYADGHIKNLLIISGSK